MKKILIAIALLSTILFPSYALATPTPWERTAATLKAYFPYTSDALGIGTTSPYAKLSVVGQIVANNIWATSTTATNYFGASIGVGTTTPTALISAQTAGAGDVLFLGRSSTNAYFALDFSGAVANFDIGVLPTFKTNLGRFLITDETTDATSKTLRFGSPHYTNSEEPFYSFLTTSTVASNQISIGGSSAIGNAATSIAFFTAANNTTTTGTQRLTIDSSGNVGVASSTPRDRFVVTGNTHLDGFVTIGSTSPFTLPVANESLHVVKNVDGYSGTSLINRSSGTVASVDLLFNNNLTDMSGSKYYGNISYAGGSNTDPLYTIMGANSLTTINSDGSIGSVISTTTANAYHFWGSGGTLSANEKMRLTQAGNLGIGTTSPYAKFAVNGDSVINGTETVTNFVATGTISATLRNAASYDGTSFSNTNSGINITNSLGTVEDSEASLRFSVTGATGNVGTGKIALVRTGNGSAGFAFGTRNNSVSAERMRITSDGNVGIGTTTPSALFHLDTVSTGGVKAMIIDSDDEADDIAFRIRTNASATNLVDTDTKFIIGGTGITGIATSSPWRTLSVTGTVGFSSTLTSATGGSNHSLCINSSTYEVLRETTSVCIPSSRVFKENIRNLNLNGLDTLMALTPRSFSYKEDITSDYRNTKYGFIAEEVAEVNPHFAEYGEKGEARNLDDRAILATVVKAVQELAVEKGVVAKRSVEENYQWILIGILFLWNIGLTIRRK